MKFTIRSRCALGLTMTLGLVILLAALSANVGIDRTVAQAQGFIVELSLGNDPVQAGTGTSVKVSIDDDWIYDVYDASSSGFFLRAWVYRTDSFLTRVPSCHGGSWPDGRPISPNGDGKRLVITTRLSGSCPPRVGSGYAMRLDVMATIDGTDTVVANRAISFTVTGARPTATATATATATETLAPAATPTPTATPSPTATTTRGSSVLKRPKQPTRWPTATPTFTPTPTQVQGNTEAVSEPPSSPAPAQPISVTDTPVTELPSDIPVVVVSEPLEDKPAPENGKRKPPPPSSCIVAHAATPVQVCRNNKTGALHFHFVGATDVFSGPTFPSITEISSNYPPGYIPYEVELYRGTSTGTGKEVLVHFVTDRGHLRVTTYYADSEYDTDKPYVFTIREDGTVTHLAW